MVNSLTVRGRMSRTIVRDEHPRTAFAIRIQSAASLSLHFPIVTRVTQSIITCTSTESLLCARPSWHEKQWIRQYTSQLPEGKSLLVTPPRFPVGDSYYVPLLLVFIPRSSLQQFEIRRGQVGKMVDVRTEELQQSGEPQQF
jgi:hypothetical protein